MCFPRERGWTGPPGGRGAARGVLPARAGVDRTNGTAPSRCVCASRASGGGPRRQAPPAAACSCFPRERGWTARAPLPRPPELVLPARAGVDRSQATQTGEPLGASRASGGGPHDHGVVGVGHPCFPRERGWTDHGERAARSEPVLPARAGVDRSRRSPTGASACASRASGGGPPSRPSPSPSVRCFPRERGWTDAPRWSARRASVLPARAGVDRPTVAPLGIAVRASRASGGGPEGIPVAGDALFVLPARAGVDRRIGLEGVAVFCASRVSGGEPYRYLPRPPKTLAVRG